MGQRSAMEKCAVMRKNPSLSGVLTEKWKTLPPVLSKGYRRDCDDKKFALKADFLLTVFSAVVYCSGLLSVRRKDRVICLSDMSPPSVKPI